MVEELVIVTYVYWACSIFFMGFQTWADLVILDMTDFNVILGMTWLSLYNTMLNFHAKAIALEILNKERLELKELDKPKLAKVIFYIQARKMGQQGCLAYLVHVRDVKAKSPFIDSISIIYKFKGVFCTDFLGMPPDSYIDFYIDLEPKSSYLCPSLMYGLSRVKRA